MLPRSIFTLLAVLNLASAHIVITYPGWRGDNLHSVGTVEETNGLGTFDNNNETLFPYGMQWMYPCGGMPTSQNRTKWPIRGGGVAFQPGWFTGHGTAFIFINLGLGTIPQNMSLSMLNGVQIIGPSRDPYPGTFCFPQVPLPANTTVNVGDNATIQIIELAVHGAALYSCVDITFAEPEDVEQLTPDNCFNSSQLSSALVFTTTSLTEESAASGLSTNLMTYFTTMAIVLLGLMFL